MSFEGILILLVFFIFAGLMISRKLPTILALPLMGITIAVIVGIPFKDIINDVIMAGSVKLTSSIVVVIFGSMFARVIMKTGISDSIIKKAAELAGDKPIPIAITLTTAIAFVFLGMNGLGAVIMIGSIALPIMTSVGIKPIVAGSLLLLGMQTGLAANAGNYGTQIGIFGGGTISLFYIPALIISGIITLIFIFVNVKPNKERSTWALPNTANLTKKNNKVPAIALLAPIIPLIVIIIFKSIWGFGAADKGMINAVGASIFGFILASFYAIVVTKPKRMINIFSGAIVEGIQDVAGVIFLFIGIGILVAVVFNPLVSSILNPIIKSIMPAGKIGFLLFFAILSPLALYRGPLNMFGMGAGIAALMVSLNVISVEALAGAFIALQYVQAISDPTNSHNVWIADYLQEETSALLKKTFPYSWAMVVCMLIFTVFTKF
ncbi:transporter [Clostridium perfringens]|uniref:transporter n=1 Tax=Clostridium perfringens TaxID=1502 RepID=UPI003BAA13BD|nr:transporter [Clostridium perfringens]